MRQAPDDTRPEGSENRPYDPVEIVWETEPSMPKRKLDPAPPETFGQRLARLRKAAGYSQRALAAELGISQRMLAYYESQTEHPPTHLLPAIAHALSQTADQLLGRDAVSARKAPRNQQLLRRLRRIEVLPASERRQVLHLIDALVERNTLKRQKAS